MYSIFKPELVELANKTLSEHIQFEEKKFSKSELNTLQLKRFKEIVLYAIKGSLFYRQLLQEYDKEYFNEFTLDSISELPFTTKNDLLKASYDISSQHLHQAWIYYETTGTTGPSTPCPRSEYDSIINNIPLVLRYQNIFKLHGDKHIVGVMGPTELHSTGDTFEDVLRSMGHTVVKMWPRSPVVGMARAIKLIKELEITALICTPAIAFELAKYNLKKGVSPDSSSIKLILTLGELITPAMLLNLESIWNAAVYNCMYASQESSILAVCKSDKQLYTVPLNNYYELIDPDTEEDILNTNGPLIGELVITNLYQGQKPLIRYRTGDMIQVTIETDGSWKIVPVGRVKDKIYINDIEVTAYDIETILFKYISGCLNYQMIIEKDGVNDVLIITLEMMDIKSEKQLDIDLITNAIHKNLNIVTQIRFGDVGAIAGTAAMVSWKAARLHDKRQQSNDVERDFALRIAQSRVK